MSQRVKEAVEPVNVNGVHVDTRESAPTQLPRPPVRQTISIAYRARNDHQRTIDQVSEDVSALTGLAPGDFTSGRARWAAIVHPDDLEQVRDELRNAVRAARPFHLEYRIRHRDGSVRWVCEQGQGVDRRDDEALALEGFITDITEHKRIESELTERNELYELLAAGSRDAIWDWDIASDRVFFSRRWSDLRGLDPEEVGDRVEHWSSGIHPEDAPRVMDAVQAHFAGATAVFAEEYRVRCKDGSWKWILDRGIARRDGRGQVVRMAGWESDISERKHMEESLRRQVELKRYYLDTVQTLIVALDAEGRISMINRKGRETLGYAEDEVIGLNWFENCLPQPAGMDEIYPIFRRIMAGELESVEYLENPIRSRDGRLRLIAWHNADLTDADGRIIGTLSSGEDITERKRAEEALRASEARFRRLADAMPQLVWTAEPDGTVDYYNIRAAEYSSIDQITDGHWNWVPVLHPDDVQCTLEAWQHAVETGDTYVCEHRVRMTDGALRWHLSRAEPVRDEAGCIVKWFGTATDIHDLKLAQERLRESDQRKDAFLATLAHELRNPLAPIRHAAEILRLKAPSDPALQAVQAMIDRQIRHLARLIDDLMEASRMTRGRVRLRRERVELAGILEPVLATFRPRAERAGQTLTLVLPTAPIHLFADPVRLTQVFQNLLDNAWKYTDKGGRIQLSAERDGTEVVVRVADTGTGIAPDQLPRVFEMFSQLDASPEQSKDGMGIGLALARGLVEMHGGRIEARSEGLSMGTELIVRLPTLSEVPAEPIQLPPEADVSLPPVAARILVVDDNADAAESLAMWLEVAGYAVEKARDGLEAVATAERFRPHLVLLDIGMPGLDGHGACRRIREQPWGKGMRIIALTGWGQDDDRRKSSASGFDGHLVKPVDPAALRQLLSELP
jgi:PAS domain S-box-containing protein